MDEVHPNYGYQTRRQICYTISSFRRCLVARIFGLLKDTVVINRDIVNPIDETWEANE